MYLYVGLYTRTHLPAGRAHRVIYLVHHLLQRIVDGITYKTQRTAHSLTRTHTHSQPDDVHTMDCNLDIHNLATVHTDTTTTGTSSTRSSDSAVFRLRSLCTQLLQPNITDIISYLNSVLFISGYTNTGPYIFQQILDYMDLIHNYSFVHICIQMLSNLFTHTYALIPEVQSYHSTLYNVIVSRIHRGALSVQHNISGDSDKVRHTCTVCCTCCSVPV